MVRQLCWQAPPIIVGKAVIDEDTDCSIQTRYFFPSYAICSKCSRIQMVQCYPPSLVHFHKELVRANTCAQAKNY